MNEREQAIQNIVDCLSKEIEKARKLLCKAEGQKNHVYSMVNNLDINFYDIPSKAENADNIYEAISCYIDYGECGMSKLKKEMFDAIDKASKPKDNKNRCISCGKEIPNSYLQICSGCANDYKF